MWDYLSLAERSAGDAAGSCHPVDGRKRRLALLPIDKPNPDERNKQPDEGAQQAETERPRDLNDLTGLLDDDGHRLRKVRPDLVQRLNHVLG